MLQLHVPWSVGHKMHVLLGFLLVFVFFQQGLNCLVKNYSDYQYYGTALGSREYDELSYTTHPTDMKALV